MVLGCHIFKVVITLVTCVHCEKIITCLSHVLRKYLRVTFKKLQGKCKFIINGVVMLNRLELSCTFLQLMRNKGKLSQIASSSIAGLHNSNFGIHLVHMSTGPKSR